MGGAAILVALLVVALVALIAVVVVAIRGALWAEETSPHDREGAGPAERPEHTVVRDTDDVA